MMKKIIFWGLLFIFYQTNLFAQENDSIVVKQTEVKTTPSFPDSIFKFKVSKPIAKRAGLYSALLPGLGQAYNKQYWKIGFVAAATGVVAYFYIDNRKNYQTYQKAYINRLNNPSIVDDYPNRSLDDLNLIRKTYRKYTEYTVIAGTVCYLINILDAFTSAHLKAFDMSKDISLRVAPVLNETKQAGVAMTFFFH